MLPETKEQIDCHNDPTWIESALPRCEHFSKFYESFYCAICCNADICRKFKLEEDREKLREMATTRNETIKVNGYNYVSMPIHTSTSPVYYYDSGEWVYISTDTNG